MNSRNQTIWILEYPPSLRSVYEEVLVKHYGLTFFASVAEIVAQLKASESLPDLFITELGFNEDDFLAFITTKAASPVSHLPFVVVSPIDDQDVLRRCFHRGAADTLTKPFGRGELIVKVERILSSQMTSQKRGPVYFEPNEDFLEIDCTSLRLSRLGKQSVPLTSKEFQILALFRSEPEQTIAREKILERIWGEVKVGSKTLDVHLFNLRKKLSALDMEIYTLPPATYRLTIKT